MYIVSFFQYLLRKSNFPVVLYLVLNTLIVSMLLGSGFSANPAIALLIGLAAYLVSLAIALSPLGEWIVRKQTKCHEIVDENTRNFIEPLFREILTKARQVNPEIPDDVELYMNESEDVNAFATGRKTVCVTQGMLRQNPEMIKATLGHEMGHLAHHDTDLILVVTVGNMIVNAFFVMVRIGGRIFKTISLLVALFSRNEDNVAAALMMHISAIVTDFILVKLMSLWTKLGTMLVMKSSRSQEYEADEFSFNLGYGEALCGLLDTFPAAHDKGLFANLMSSHPDKNERIKRLVSLGVQYNPIGI